MNRRNKTGASSDMLDGYLSLGWHGAHDGGEGRNREIYTIVALAKEVRGGAVDFYFCSPRCLRRFLNQCVDDLELGIRKAMRDSKRSDRKSDKQRRAATNAS